MIDKFETGLTDKRLFFNRIDKYDPRVSLLGDGIHYADVTQGNAGTCYVMAAVASLARYPEYVKSMFLNDKNHAGIYAVRFYIRGKPWIITIDDTILFQNPVAPKPYFAHINPIDHSIYPALIEKAWAKMKGTYSHTESGFV